LEHLALIWEFTELDWEVDSTEFTLSNKLVPPESEMPAFAVLRAAPIEKCPMLMHIYIATDCFLFQWRKLADGTAEESTVYDFGENYQLKLSRPRQTY
jgi:hypothetical protein